MLGYKVLYSKPYCRLPCTHEGVQYLGSNAIDSFLHAYSHKQEPSTTQHQVKPYLMKG